MRQYLSKSLFAAILFCTAGIPTFSQDCQSGLICVSCEGDIPTTPCEHEWVDEAYAHYLHGLKYICVFEDEFTGDNIDWDKWQHQSVTPPYWNQLPPTFCTDDQFQFNVPGYQGLSIITDVGSGLPSGYTFISGALTSQYLLPSQNPLPYINRNGIFEMKAILPQASQTSNLLAPDPPYGNLGSNGSIWPAFWMYCGHDPAPEYNEIDGFEFSKSQWEDIMTTHYPTVSDQCAATYALPGVAFGDGNMRDFEILYTPEEIDWFVQNDLFRSDTRFYWDNDYPDFDCSGDDGVNPVYYYNFPSSYSALFSNYIYPTADMWLEVGDVAQVGADLSVFPVRMNVQSIKYWEILPCSGTNDVTASMINNVDDATDTWHGEDEFNVFTGMIVNLNGPINIPWEKHPWKSAYPGQLEAIASSSIVITGTFVNSGYFVAKTDNNLCDEYTGNLPINYYDTYSLVKGGKGGNDSTQNTGNITNHISQDSLVIFAKEFPTLNQTSIILKNIDNSLINKSANLSVYNILGQVLYQSNIILEENQEYPVNFATKAAGVYLVILRSNDKMLEKKIIVK